EFFEQVIVICDFGVSASVAVTVNVTDAPLGPVASFVMFAGTVSTGAAPLLVIVTVNVAVRVLPRVSEAVQVTVVVPVGNVEPDAGVHVTVRGPSTRSLAVGFV